MPIVAATIETHTIRLSSGLSCRGLAPCLSGGPGTGARSSSARTHATRTLRAFRSLEGRQEDWGPLGNHALRTLGKTGLHWVIRDSTSSPFTLGALFDGFAPGQEERSKGSAGFPRLFRARSLFPGRCVPGPASGSPPPPYDPAPRTMAFRTDYAWKAPGNHLRRSCPFTRPRSHEETARVWSLGFLSLASSPCAGGSAREDRRRRIGHGP